MPKKSVVIVGKIPAGYRKDIPTKRENSNMLNAICRQLKKAGFNAALVRGALVPILEIEAVRQVGTRKKVLSFIVRMD